jgi:hypothetical protein
MASWLKAAEDLFEVVDRRAKSVVEDLSEEQNDLQLPASGRKGSQGKRTSSKKKVFTVDLLSVSRSRCLVHQYSR